MTANFYTKYPLFLSRLWPPRDPREGIRVGACPFCGGPPDIRYNSERGANGEFYTTAKIACVNCGASTRSFVLIGDIDERDVIEAWNGRI